jgi:hypothetical protein
VVEHPKEFHHVGLLVNKPPGTAGLLFIESSDDFDSISGRATLKLLLLDQHLIVGRGIAKASRFAGLRGNCNPIIFHTGASIRSSSLVFKQANAEG